MVKIMFLKSVGFNGRLTFISSGNKENSGDSFKLPYFIGILEHCEVMVSAFYRPHYIEAECLNFISKEP